ncbi:Variant Surface Glycoprotein [Trypanosoma brucei equiperdum]|uniref:Variant Surface Glycoprotein n=2 Tax=Trypanosoma brucei TaxID=5691 RepID=A0A3L6KVN2_9TRYP|nr:variant surface glycoprotein 1125.4927 [Trypanosoma brucei]RHW67946.1 Variant Surface Glycoprotein [Trypanosoma brucei equiperdum]
MHKKINSALALVLPITFSCCVCSCHAAAGNAIKHELWKPLCDVAHKLSATSPDATSKLQNSVDAATGLIANRLKMIIYATVTDGGDKMANWVAAAGTDAVKIISSQQLKAAIGFALDAQDKASYIQGRIAEFAQLAADASGTTPTHGCPSISGNNRAVQGSAELGKCGLEAVITDGENTGNNKLVADSLYNGLPTGGAGPSQTGTTVDNCALTAHTGNTILKTENLRVNLKFAGDYITVQQASGDAKAADKPTKDSTTTYKAPQHYKAAGEALLQLAATKLSATPSVKTPKIADLTSSDAACRLSHTWLLNQTKPYDKSQHQEAAAKKIRDELKDADNSGAIGAWTALQDFDIPNSIFSDRSDGNTKLGQIGDPQQLLTILTYYQVQKTAELRKLRGEVTRLRNAIAQDPSGPEQLLQQNRRAAEV